MTQLVKAIATKAWWPKFTPLYLYKVGKERTNSTKLSFDLHTQARAHTDPKQYIKELKPKPMLFIIEKMLCYCFDTAFLFYPFWESYVTV